VGPRWKEWDSAFRLAKLLSLGRNKIDAVAIVKAQDAGSWAGAKAKEAGAWASTKGKALLARLKSAHNDPVKPGKGKRGKGKKGRKDNPADMRVAEEIVRQLGGTGRLKVMIGGRDFMGGANDLQFKWAAKAKNGANSVRIVLDPSDTYTVTFYSVRGMNVKEKGTFSDVYNDNLRGLFESETGLYLSL
jgi:hypothetical protein